MEYFGLSDIGKTREINQDAFCAHDNVFILCDGMGGHKAGEIASNEAVADIDAVLGELMNEEGGIFVKITSAVNHANNRVYRMSLENPVYSGMGTTCDVCVITQDGVHIGHVGDSRVYMYSSGGLFQITKDHSLVEEMIDSGEISRSEAESFVSKNYITRALGTQPGVRTDTYLAAFKPGDILLMCSDGLTNMVPEIDIAYVLSSKMTLEEMAKELISRANDNGGPDNITVVLVRK